MNIKLRPIDKINEYINRLIPDMAIDLGTANTLVFIRGMGVVLDEPSVVAISRKKREILAVGGEAKKMLGRTPQSIVAIRPLKDGVIADFRVAEEMIKYFIRKVRPRRTVIKPRIAVCVPTGITDVEKRAVRDSAVAVGAREVLLIEEPVAAAIGVGLPISKPVGSMVADIGGGTTEVAVLSMNGIVCKASIRIAGDEIDEEIDAYMKKAYGLLVGEQTAEYIKMEACSAYPLEKEITISIKGRDIAAGIPKTIKISSKEMREAINESLQTIIAAIRSTLEDTPPDLSADIKRDGIVLAGGGSLLKGLDKAISEELDLPVRVAADALTCIVTGTGMVLENPEAYGDLILRDL
ncbi:MAG: rod shape-determining protein [bacterium]|nr:rod shape-determining protein [bacterium]